MYSACLDRIRTNLWLELIAPFSSPVCLSVAFGVVILGGFDHCKCPGGPDGEILETKSYNAAIKVGNFRPFDTKDKIVICS
jgi:hypothetical protein